MAGNRELRTSTWQEEAVEQTLEALDFEYICTEAK